LREGYPLKPYAKFFNNFVKIWLVQIGEPLPLNKKVRKLRTAILADRLVSRGHEVRWWASAFDHNLKVTLFPQDQELRLSPGLALHILKGCGYAGNISLSRYLDHRLIAAKFRRQAGRLAPPDIVVASMPCHHVAFEAVRYARCRNIPVLVDVRDLWPDIFLTKVRKAAHPKNRTTGPQFRFSPALVVINESRRCGGRFQGLSGMGFGKNRETGGEWDRVFFLGYQPASGRTKPLNPPPWLKGQETKKLIFSSAPLGSLMT
jgi:hypothetical protein